MDHKGVCKKKRSEVMETYGCEEKWQIHCGKEKTYICKKLEKKEMYH